MKAHWKYLRYVLRHKIFVYQEGRKIGVGRWRLLRHDLSKFLPDEWMPYADYFYGGPWPERNYGDFRAYLGDKFTQTWVNDRFNVAWLKHQRRNPHHWQHWILREDSGATLTLEMPYAAALEMVADWAGAGKAIHGTVDIAAWYDNNKDKIAMHPRTRNVVEYVIAKHYRDEFFGKQEDA